ncbi:uncharacterized protein N0V89_000552 [Didymosphaeria variabile]|uniref:C2H2-type domain-containing protein n=1 Tax=Didymosphaeria variabile TaxID=1932322 RepID=A0A9W8XVD8_9PLEO|nr:uncharacterized protein N0V89_000552 [Didymosphaeria variabile]KAJ4359993.1 hypothetical protein N0V89_000552 [Didymosphaeria variabile]
MHIASSDPGQLQSSIGQGALHEPLNEPNSADLAPKQFICTFCLELGMQKIIKTKQDWKRHEEDYHDGTGLQWICQVRGCAEVFSRGLDFRNHLKKGHEGKKFPRDCKEVRQLPRIYACGFENCRGGLLKTWKHHCDHVATHMVEGDTSWTYNRTIRNLLKHRDISAHWKQVYGILCPQLHILHSNLTWDAQTTSTMRAQLETHNFGGRLEDFLLKLFHSGLPSAQANAFANMMPSSGLASPLLYSAPPIIPPILPSPMDFGFDPSFGSHSAHQTVTGPTSNGMVASAPNNRNSVTMADAPPLFEPDTFNACLDDPFKEIPQMANELISLPNFIAETSPDYDAYLPEVEDHTAVQDNNRSHSPRALAAKTRGWLASKKSQHFQHMTIEHPDVPRNVRLPNSSSRKRCTTTVHRVRNDQT